MILVEEVCRCAIGGGFEVPKVYTIPQLAFTCLKSVDEDVRYCSSTLPACLPAAMFPDMMIINSIPVEI